MEVNLDKILSLDITSMQIFLVLFGATIAGFCIALTYKKTHRGLSYSVSFTNTIVLLTVITAIILLVIGDNLARAIGIFGAFSVIRFRTAIKDPRDLTFLFIALASGFAVGTGSALVAAIGIPFLLALILVLYHTGFGEQPKFDYILHCKIQAENYEEDQLKQFLLKNFQEYQMLNVESREKGKILLLNFNIREKRKISIDQTLKLLHKIDGVEEAHAVRSKNDLDF